MKKLLITFTLFITGYTAIAQPGPPLCNDFVTVNGHDFKCGNELFYPVATVYTFRIGYNVTGAPLSDYFLMRCNSYGPCDDVINHYCGYESNTAIDCSAEIASDLGFIHQMGFNTIRTHELGAFFYTPNWFPNHNPIDLNNILIPTVFIPAANNATFGYGLELTKNQQGIDNRQRAFELIKEMLSQAHANSLKVLLDVGYSDVSDDYRNGSVYNNIDTYCTYLTQLASYIESLPLALRQTLIAYIIIEEPIYSNQTGNPKAAICDKTKKMYDAIKAGDTQHLISLGGDDLYDLMEWDPGVMKLDFWCPHFYPSANRDIEPNSDLAVERVLSQIYWLKNNCPMPWHIGETGYSATTDEVGLLNGWAAGHYSYPFVDGEIDATSFIDPTNPVYNQENYAETILKYVRDCKGNGLTWWQYQELWNTATFSAMIGNNYSLLKHGIVNANTFTFAGVKKPLVAKFESYLNAAGQPPAIDPLSGQMPTHYYDPYNHAAIATNVYSQAHKVNGYVYDENGKAIKDAIVYGYTWTEYDEPKKINNYDLYYTFTDANGHFELIPINTKDQTDNTQFVNYIRVGSVGKKNSDFGYPWPPPANDLVFEPDYLNGTNIPFNYPLAELNSNYTNYDCEVMNYSVYPDLYVGQQNDFQGINSLKVSNFDVYGGTYASIVELKARNEVTIKATTSSTFYSGSEVLIYNTTELPECIDNVGYKMSSNNNNQGNQKRTASKSIEIKFTAKDELLLTAQPNPSRDEFNVVITDATEASYQLKVFDSFSRELFQTVIPPTYVLNLSAHPTGIYFLQVQSTTSLKTIKLIKQ